MQDDTQQPYQPPQTPPVQPSLPGAQAPQPLAAVTPQAAAGPAMPSPVQIAPPGNPIPPEPGPGAVQPSLPVPPVQPFGPGSADVPAAPPTPVAGQQNVPTPRPTLKSFGPAKNPRKKIIVTALASLLFLVVLIAGYLTWQFYHLEGLRTEAQKTIDAHIEALKSADQSRIANEAFGMNNVAENTTQREEINRVQNDAFTLGLVAASLRKGSLELYDQQFGTSADGKDYLLTTYYEIKTGGQSAYYKVQAVKKLGASSWKAQGANVDDTKFERE